MQPVGWRVMQKKVMRHVGPLTKLMAAIEETSQCDVGACMKRFEKHKNV